MPIQYNILQRGFKNVSQNGQITGFQVMIKTGYYRGVMLSLIEGFEVSVDGESFTAEQTRITINNRTYTFAELANVSDAWWHWLEPATLTISKPGGLKPAVHDVKVTVKLRISYMARVPNTYNFNDKLVLMS
jgi:hypothetical protein